MKFYQTEIRKIIINNEEKECLLMATTEGTIAVDKQKNVYKCPEIKLKEIEITAAISGLPNLSDTFSESIKNQYDAGMNTTTGMWEMLSDILAEYDERLPDSLNNAIYALRDGHAMIKNKKE